MKQQTFLDGILELCAVENHSEPGERPKDVLRHKLNLRFAERTVGTMRYYQAMQQQIKPELVLRVQRLEGICPGDVVLLRGKQYQLTRVQLVPDVKPSCVDLELMRLEQYYAF